MQAELICANCKFFDEPLMNCIAFPSGIPEVIISGENDHSKPLPEQGNSVTFQPSATRT
jgi:hypothetical protein